MTDAKASVALLAPPAQWYEREATAHVVQFYQDEALFLNELTRFVGTALVSGETAIIIATEAHREHLAAQLRERGLDLSRAARQGRYESVDAAELLAKIMVNGQPDPARFMTQVGSLFASLAGSENGARPRVAVFGEMVALLWAQGKVNAALRIEELWNELARSQPFSLRCAYPTNGFMRPEDGESFLKICDAHSGIIPDDSYTKLAGDQERLRKVAELQQAAQVAAELAKLNENLRQSEERFRLLVEHVKDYAIFMLSPEGNILSWNIGAERIKGYRPEEIIGKHFSTFYAPEDVQSGKPQRGLKIAAAEGRYADEGWRVRKDGSRFWATVVITALFDSAGSLKGFSKVTRDITERKNAEEAVRHLSGRLLRAHDEERRRLGRELHDSTAQTLAAVSINLALLNEYADFSANPKASKVLAETTDLAEQASRELRTLSYVLHPPTLDQAGLRSALSWYVDGFSKRTKIRIELEIAPGLERLPQDVETALFRIVQESLSNVYRHSGSSTARVRLTLASGEIALEVSDEGKGLPASALDGTNPALVPPGVGIAGMRERMHQLGGRLEITSGPVGTSVKAILPIELAKSYSQPAVTQELDGLVFPSSQPAHKR